MLSYIRFADRLSAWFGKTFGWLIILMTAGMSYEVFARYLFNAPTPWALDLSFIMYGTLFMMGGAYTLSRGGHVRGDFIYRTWAPKRQALVDLILYVLFFFPGILALIFAGWKYASRSWGYAEVSINSPAGIPIYQFKTVIVAAGILLVDPGHRAGVPLHHLHAHEHLGRGRPGCRGNRTGSAETGCRRAVEMIRVRANRSDPK
jgi:TRAP-type mannitol/chloroaromatic compound transport system permease small subunit